MKGMETISSGKGIINGYRLESVTFASVRLLPI